MASKLVFLAAAMAALVVMTHATEVDSENLDIGSERCRRDFQSQWPGHCGAHITILHSRIKHGLKSAEAGRSQYFDKCCEELRRLEPDCQCEAVQRVAYGYEVALGWRLRHTLLGQAREIPKMCGNMDRRCRMMSFIMDQ